MIKSTEQHPSREARYPVLQGRRIGVTIVRDTSPPDTIEANLVDVSRKGVKLLVADCPSMEEAVVLNLAVPEIGLDLSVDAQICWTRTAPNDAWHLGCVLNPELPEELLTDLAVQGYLQRRRDPRYPIDLSATMRCEGSLDPVPARVLDYSVGGFRLESSHRAAPGRRLLVRFDEGPACRDLVVAKTMWQAQTDSGHQMGCTFVNREGHRIFQEVLRKAQGGSAADPAAGRQRSRWLLLALAATVAGVAALRFFLLT